MGDANTRRKDPTWKYTKLKSESNTLCHICIYCGKETNGGISRAKEHLIGPINTLKRSNVTKCKKVPQEVKEELLAYQEGTKRLKHSLCLEHNENIMENNEEDIQMPFYAGKRTLESSSVVGSTSSIASKHPRMKGPMDHFMYTAPEKEVEKRKQLRQTGIKENFDKDARDRTIQYVARWFYQAGIPFNAAKFESFEHMIEAIGQYGPGLKPPSYHELRVPLLERELEATKNNIKEHRKVWEEKGCTIMSDGWTDRRDRSIINFLVNSPSGTVFLESIDSSEYSKTGVKLFELLDAQVEKIGEENVMQVVTDNHSSYVLAG